MSRRMISGKGVIEIDESEKDDDFREARDRDRER